jgi:hypothetical protein
MIPKIIPGENLRQAVNYNEHKLAKGTAEFIHSKNYLKDTEYLTFSDKLGRLQDLAALNQGTKLNSIHISLNFDPSEKISVEILRRITDEYMEKIGFGEQPYLVYQHHDAGHPHLHIVTTNIRENGRRIELHNIGKIQSKKARKELEIKFGLVQADSKKQQQVFELKPVNAQKIQYGKSETRQAITNVLKAVIPHYKYTSLHQLNAVLNLYNVHADPGSENSRQFQHKGLVYRILDDNGQKVGVPIKASRIYFKPTLRYLEKRFTENEQVKEKDKRKAKNAIDLAIARRPRQTMQELGKALQTEGIRLVVRQNKEGIIYGLTYVDHRTKSVFNGSDLGKSYSANAVQVRLNASPIQAPAKQATQKAEDHTTRPQQAPDHLGKIPGFLQELMQPEETPGTLAYELRDDLKKKRKKKYHP